MIIYDDDGVGYEVVPMSVIEDIRAEIDEQIIPRSSYTDKQKKQVLKIIDRHIRGKDQK